MITFGSPKNIITFVAMASFTKFHLASLLLAFLGVLPFYRNNKFKPCRTYTAILVTVDAILFLYTICNFASKESAYYNVYSFSFLLALVIHSSLIVDMSWRKAIFLEDLMEMLRSIDLDLSDMEVLVPGSCSPTGVFIAINFGFWGILGPQSVFIFREMQVPVYIFIFQLRSGFTFCMTGWLVHSVLSQTCIRLALVNKLLLDVRSNKSGKLPSTIAGISNLHVKLCDFVDLTNKVFGSFLLCYFVVSFVSVLCSISFMKYNFLPFHECLMIGVSISCIISIQVAIALKSEQLINEGTTFVANSYRGMSYYSRVKHLKDEFIILAQQGYTRSPKVTAAGFFTYSHAMLYMFINTVATYVVVVLQFTLNNSSDTKT